MPCYPGLTFWADLCCDCSALSLHAKSPTRNVIEPHFSPLINGNFFVTRLIYFGEKLITANKVHHLGECYKFTVILNE